MKKTTEDQFVLGWERAMQYARVVVSNALADRRDPRQALEQEIISAWQVKKGIRDVRRFRSS